MPCTAESPSPRLVFWVVKKGSKILAGGLVESGATIVNFHRDALPWLQLAACKIGLDVVVITACRSVVTSIVPTCSPIASPPLMTQVHHDLLNL
jgi:hypothetical protein